MKLNQVAIRIPAFALAALLGATMLPATGVAAEDSQADLEARRIENEARRQQEIGRREIEDRDRTQAEALRSQEQAIQRMEATQSRLNAAAERAAQESRDQARINSYPYSVPLPPVVLPATPEARALAGGARVGDPISGMNFAPLSDRLKSYFGAQSGVLVVSAGTTAPFGLQDGDVIIAVDGRVPADGPHAERILRSYQPGERVKLRVQRDRRVIDLDATAPGKRSN